MAQEGESSGKDASHVETLTATVRRLEEQNQQMRRQLDQLTQKIPNGECEGTNENENDNPQSEDEDDLRSNAVPPGGDNSVRYSSNHPFTDYVMTVPLPEHFKVPSIELYDGMGDPQEHLDMFNSAMLVSGATDPIRCRTFPSTLKQSGLRWYSSLPQNSIPDFSTLATQFLINFSTSRVHQKTSASLINLKQGEDETLREFLSRFNQEALQIRDLNPAVALHAVLAGLRPGPFADSLARKPPSSMDELRRRSAGYINMEEVAIAKNAERAKDENFRPRKEHRDHSDQNNNARSHHQVNQSNFREYTPLNSSRGEILQAIYNTSLIKFPPPPKHQNPNADRSRRCDYHKVFGHTTEECTTLKDFIEGLINKGHLSQYVLRTKRIGRDSRSASPQGAQPTSSERSMHSHRRDDKRLKQSEGNSESFHSWRN